MGTETNAAIPADIQELLDVFAKSLSDVRFPDVDGAALESLAAAVRGHATELAQLGEKVRAAQQALETAQLELRKAARRGLAYARVFAEGNPALSEKLAGLSLDDGDAPADKPARKRPGRPPKADRAAKGAGKKAAAEQPLLDSQDVA